MCRSRTYRPFIPLPKQRIDILIRIPLQPGGKPGFWTIYHRVIHLGVCSYDTVALSIAEVLGHDVAENARHDIMRPAVHVVVPGHLSGHRVQASICL